MKSEKDKPGKLEEHSPAGHDSASVPALSSPAQTPMPGSASYQCNNALCQLAGSHIYNCLVAEVERLRAALGKYRHCRHACIECFCTVEAVAALERKP